STGTGSFHYRKHFTVTNITDRKLLLNLLADGYAEVYLNGNLIHAQDTSDTPGKYWNSEDIVIKASNLFIGDNVIAVKLMNPNVSAKFDLKLTLTNLRNKFIIVMSDGAATRTCAVQGTGSDSVDAIKAACDLHSDYGIIIHTVGFGSAADAFTMRGIADCGKGNYYRSNDANQLRQIYNDIADAVIQYNSQVAQVTGDVSRTVLYPVSNISYSYIPEYSEGYGNITLNLESQDFSDISGDDIDKPFKRGRFFVPNNTKVTEARVISYSSEWWTDEVNITSDPDSNGTEIYKLYDYNSIYNSLGDPFIVNIPVNYISEGMYNYVNVRTGKTPYDSEGGSPDNKIIYNINVKSYVNYGDVFQKSDGCIWEVEFYDTSKSNITIPSDYSGSDLCYYTNSTTTENPEDAYNDAALRLFERLDSNSDHRLDIILSEDNILIKASVISDIPWMWGPIIITLSIGN
ncbi:MAG: VWA domain-containing protein, partial [Nanoarchaeota archaeon]|nr:VWA domain-containing protein [Nanoarchaeota archaeon]